MHYRRAARELGNSESICKSRSLVEVVRSGWPFPAACCDCRATSHCRSHRSSGSASLHCTVRQHRLGCCLVWYLGGRCLYCGGGAVLRRIGSRAALSSWAWPPALRFPLLVTSHVLKRHSTSSWCWTYWGCKAWSRRPGLNTCPASCYRKKRKSRVSQLFGNPISNNKVLLKTKLTLTKMKPSSFKWKRVARLRLRLADWCRNGLAGWGEICGPWSSLGFVSPYSSCSRLRGSALPLRLLKFLQFQPEEENN